MPERHTTKSSKTPPGILFRYRGEDSRHGVSRRTVAALVKRLGLTETQIIHVALADLARRELPQYAPDDGMVSADQIRRIKKLEPQGRIKISASLF